MVDLVSGRKMLREIDVTTDRAAWEYVSTGSSDLGRSRSAENSTRATNWRVEHAHPASFSEFWKAVTFVGQAGKLNADYEELRLALEVMAGADEDESFYIDEDTYRAALNFTNLMRLFDVPAPKAFAHGGDAVTFAWDRGSGRRYLTVGERRARLIEVQARGTISCEAKAAFDASQYPMLMSILGGKNWSNRAAV